MKRAEREAALRAGFVEKYPSADDNDATVYFYWEVTALETNNGPIVVKVFTVDIGYRSHGDPHTRMRFDRFADADRYVFKHRAKTPKEVAMLALGLDIPDE